MEDYENNMRACFWSFIGITLMLLIVLATSCSSSRNTTNTTTKEAVLHTENIIQRDTQKEASRDTILQHDTVAATTKTSISVTPRQVEVQLPLPQITREREMIINPASNTDTTSTLETPYFTSIAAWSHGKLTHRIKTKPGSAVTGWVQATDTTRTTETLLATSRNRRETSERQTVKTSTGRITDSTTTTKTLQQAAPMKRKHHQWMVWAILAVAIAAALLYFILRAAAIRKRMS